MATSDSAAARACVGFVIAVAVEDADNEIQSCGGSHDDWHWLRALVTTAFTGSQLLVDRLRDEAALVRVGALTGLTAILDAWADDALRDAMSSWPVTWERELWSALDDPAPPVRAAALTALTRLTDMPEGAGWLEDSLYDADPEVRCAAVDAAARHLGRAAEARLLELAQAPEEPAGQPATTQLVELASPLAGAALLARLDAGVHVEETLSLIARAGLDELPVAPLARYLSDDAPPRTQVAAARVMVEWAATDPETSHPALIRTLTRGDFSAVHAAIALARTPTPAAESALIQTLLAPLPALESRSIGAVSKLRDAAARALGSAGSELAREALLESPFQAVRTRDRGPRSAALCGALGMLEHPSATPRIQQLLSDTTVTQRVAAIALGQSGVPASARLLRRWLRDEKDTRLRAHAALGLLLLQPDRVSVDAMALLRHPPEPVAATYDAVALAIAAGLRSLGRLATQRRVSRDALAACLNWSLAHGDAVEDMVLCYRGRGRSIGDSNGYAFWLRDIFTEAEGLLSQALRRQRG